MHTLEHYEHVCTHIHCDTPSHLVVLELATRFMSYLNCLFPMIDVQFATFRCPYDHALSHPRYQRQQIEYSELVDLGTGVWFLRGKGSRDFSCLLIFSFQLLLLSHPHAKVTDPAPPPPCITLQLMSRPEMPLASASLHTDFLDYFDGRHHPIS